MAVSSPPAPVQSDRSFVKTCVLLLAVALAVFVVRSSLKKRGQQPATPAPGTPRTSTPAEALSVPPPTIPHAAAELATPGFTTPPPVAPLTPSAGMKLFVNSLGMEFVAGPTGGVWFCRCETRVQDYRAFAEATQREVEQPPFAQGDDHPLVNVSWDDAKAFCTWLSQKEGRVYRLPTDEEWSAAVGLRSEVGASPKEKQGKADGYPWGAQWPPPRGAGNFADAAAKQAHPDFGAISLYDDGFAETAPVGSFATRAPGPCDLGGNVTEWCEDPYNPSDPKPDAHRVFRGSSWRGAVPDALRSSYRGYDRPERRSTHGGFRVVRVAGAR